MNYYMNNMDAMKQYRAKLHQMLQDPDQYIEINKLDEIYSEQTKNGELCLFIKSKGNQYRLTSSYNPQHEAQRWSEQYNFTSFNTIITQFGFGTGSFTREIIKKRGEKDILFIYEPCPELFFHVLNNYDITDIIQAGNVIITIEGINEFEFHNLLQNAVNITNIATQIRFSHPYYETAFPESGIKYWTEIKDNYFHTRISINTEMFFGERFIINALYNARFLKNSNRLLELQPELNLDAPAIIVAAGPSLQKNIDELKKAKGKAYIFVVDRILDYVLDQGIIPDFIVTIDPIKPIEYFTQRTDLTIPLLCELVSNWEVLDHHKGRKIVYSCVPFFQKMYQSLGMNPPTLTTGASVATAAFAACVKLGFQKIILVGQDLAYDGDVTHAGGVEEKIERARDLMVEGMDGSQVRSRHDWYEFLVWFKDFLTLMPDLLVLDTKEKGAKIQGTVAMPLKEAIEQYGADITDVEVTLSNKPCTFDEPDMIKVRKYFDESYEELYRLKKKAKEAIEVCESQVRFYSRNYLDTPITEKNYRKISQINKYIIEQPLYLLLETYITASSAQQLSELYQFTENEQEDKIATYKKSICIFQSIIDGIDYVKPLFEEMMAYI